MEPLFSTNLHVNHTNVAYQVNFDHEKYMFIPEAAQSNLPAFSFKREHDEWHNLELLDPQLKKQAISALEKYLLSQH